jgi:endonuclease/exonuclease/phosphatase family metal-dependent hydrolase
MLAPVLFCLMAFLFVNGCTSNTLKKEMWFVDICEPIDNCNIKVFSFNIAGDDKNWETRKSACYDVINTRKPDIIGFQELLPVNLKWALDNFPQLGWYGLTIEGSSKAYPTDVEGESCRIMYNANRFWVDSANSGAFWFSSTPDVPSEGWDDLRYCVYVRLVDNTTSEAVYLYNTHWAFGSGGQNSRTNAAQIMVDRISSRAHTEDPFIVTGDFNATNSDEGLHILLQNMTTVVQNRIDWIFAESGKYELVSSDIISDINGTAVSDHNVLAAELTITE